MYSDLLLQEIRAFLKVWIDSVDDDHATARVSNGLSNLIDIRIIRPESLPVKKWKEIVKPAGGVEERFTLTAKTSDQGQGASIRIATIDIWGVHFPVEAP